ncbi:MAG: S8 family serine peptidase [Candidatus Eremiobacteraeota bacterium]|nr:S8 family serine peptidase [Candidatus Eremiobacteraeota bacterium]
MASALPFPPFLPLPDRARPSVPLPEVPQNPPAGSLVIVDSFVESQQGAGHGNVAAFAARQQGFRGNIYAEPIGGDHPNPTDQAWPARQVLNFPQTPEFTRQAVQDISRYRQRELLEAVTGDLDKLRERGLHDSAVNVSYGDSPMRVADQLLDEVRRGMHPMSENYQMTQNILRAYNIDAGKLGDADPAISGPERHRLQQALLEAAERGSQSPDVQQARGQYQAAVRGLQARHNSVVVASGNDQEVAGQWAREANGIQPVAGAGAGRNVLVNSDVTTVGATQWLRGANGLRERVAPYSSQDSEVDIYASGAVGNGPDVNRRHVGGTSFASPRVAAAEATLRGTHPGASPQQIRNLMNNRLTHSLPNPQGVGVLDYERTELYMRRGTF